MRYLENYWTEFHWTFSVGAFWDKDKRANVWGHKVKGKVTAWPRAQRAGATELEHWVVTSSLTSVLEQDFYRQDTRPASKHRMTVTCTGWSQTWKTWNTQGFLWTWKTQGILGEFCATPGKNCNKQSTFSLSFKYLCKTAVDWVILLEFMCDDPWGRSLLLLLFVVITYGKVGLWLWKSLENSGNFFLLCGHPAVSLNKLLCK